MPGRAGAMSRASAAMWVLLGALAVIGPWVVVTSSGDRAGAAPDTSSIELALVDGDEPAPGACLAWRPDLPGRAAVVDCRAPHQVEIVAVLEHPPGASAEGACRAALHAALDGRWDPRGRLVPLLIEETAGAASPRWCAARLASADRPDELEPFRGRLVDQVQAAAVPSGTCLDGDALDELVPCSGPHRARSAGPVPVDELPADDAGWLDTAMRGTCRQLADAALGRSTAAVDLDGRPVLTGAPIRPVLVPIADESWQAGTRSTTCLLVLDRR